MGFRAFAFGVVFCLGSAYGNCVGIAPNEFMIRAAIRFQPSQLLAAMLVLLGLKFAMVDASAAFVRVGGIAQDFTLKNWQTGQLTSLRDFAGKIIFLDMFAYW